MTLTNYFQSLFFCTEHNLSYATYCDEMLQKVEVIDIIKEKGQEPIYHLRLQDYNLSENLYYIKMSKSDYEKYIGDGVNAIRVKCATLYMVLNRVFAQNKVLHLTRKSYPWSQESAEFTESEIVSCGNAILTAPRDPKIAISYASGRYVERNTAHDGYMDDLMKYTDLTNRFGEHTPHQTAAPREM